MSQSSMKVLIRLWLPVSPMSNLQDLCSWKNSRKSKQMAGIHLLLIVTIGCFSKKLCKF